MYFYGSNQGPPAMGQHRAILDHTSFIWTNVIKGHKAMLHTKFQASEHSGSEEENF